MDIDSVAFHTDTFAPTRVFGATKKNLTDNPQISGGLMRYHSAPISMLAGLLDEDIFLRDSGSFTQVENSELAQFLSDELCTPNSVCNSKTSFPTEKGRGFSTTGTRLHIHEKRVATQQSQYMATGCNRSSPNVRRDPLSSILEHSTDDSSNNFCTPDIGNQKTEHLVVVGNQSTSNNSPSKPPITNLGRPSHVKSNLIRHNSSPADVLSRLVMEEGSEGPISQFKGSYVQATAEGMPQDNTRGSKPFPLATAGRLPANGSSFNGVSNFSKFKDDSRAVVETGSLESPPGVTKSGLLRQSSSPVGLLSEVSLDWMPSSVGEKLSMSSLSGNSSEDDRRGGTSVFVNQAAGFWDEVGLGTEAFGQRKRGREIEGKMLQGTESLKRYAGEQETSYLNHFGMHANTSPARLASVEASWVDSVLCRARAKRGCATHPRSIAERVRRTKISERMRKLQELVPNMEKQTNIAAMLDEAAEYVKDLQRQVQELLENRSKCSGVCHSKGNTLGGLHT